MVLKQPTMDSPAAAMSSAGRMMVVRYRDGRMIKGTTQDFMPNKTSFHVYPNGDESSAAVAITFDAVKAIFFVKSFEGCKGREASYSFEKNKGYGRKCVVKFADGETIAGYTTGYNSTRPGFFVVPADAESNNARIFVVNAAVETVTWA